MTELPENAATSFGLSFFDDQRKILMYSQKVLLEILSSL